LNSTSKPADDSEKTEKPEEKKTLFGLPPPGKGLFG